ncbi:MAG: hypothetical protein WAM60_23820 [Candidatus Promineifilaceae bacterium]
MKSHEHDEQIQTAKVSKNSTPSIFRLNLLEISAGLLMGVLVILNVRHSIQSIGPIFNYESYEIYLARTKAELLRNYGWIFFSLVFLATVSLIRCVRHQYHLVPHLGQISPNGYFSFIWPIIFLIPYFPDTFILFCWAWWPVTLAISVIMYVRSVKKQNNQGDLLPVLLNLLTFFPLIAYSLRIFDLTFD